MEDFVRINMDMGEFYFIAGDTCPKILSI